MGWNFHRLGTMVCPSLSALPSLQRSSSHTYWSEHRINIEPEQVSGTTSSFTVSSTPMARLWPHCSVHPMPFPALRLGRPVRLSWFRREACQVLTKRNMIRVGQAPGHSAGRISWDVYVRPLWKRWGRWMWEAEVVEEVPAWCSSKWSYSSRGSDGTQYGTQSCSKDPSQFHRECRWEWRTLQPPPTHQ